MSNTMDIEDMADRINEMTNQDDLVALSHEIHDRLKVLHRKKAQRIRKKLKVGDTVVINDKIRPKYLQGIKVTIAEMGPQRFISEPLPQDPTLRRWSGVVGRFYYTSVKGKVKK